MVLLFDLSLTGILVRASVDLGNATYPSLHEPTLLPWLSGFISYSLEFPDTWSMPDEACLPERLRIVVYPVPHNVIHSMDLKVSQAESRMWNKS
jgi:hypothetical protein